MPLSAEKAALHLARQRKYERTAKGKAAHSRYKRSAKGKASEQRYGQSEKGRARFARYERKPHRKEQQMWRGRSERSHRRIQESRI